MTTYINLKPETKLMFAIFGERYNDNADSFLREEVNGISLHDALMKELDNLSYHPYHLPVTFKQRYKKVVLLRFGFESQDGSGKTLEQVGGEFGLTRERIRQIEAKTLRLLRHSSRAKQLKEYFKEEY